MAGQNEDERVYEAEIARPLVSPVSSLFVAAECAVADSRPK